MSSIALLASALLVGCQNRARTDLYVDSMAAEIRDLEDQLYHYDHEYRLLEQELETLRRRNAAIVDQLGKSPSQQLQQVPKANSPLEFLPPKQESPTPQNGKSQSVKPQNNGPQQADEKTPGPARPSEGSEPGKTDSGIRSDIDRSPPSILNESQAPLSFPNPSSEELPPPNKAPSLPPLNQPQLPSSGSSDLEFNAGDLIIPSITTGPLTPPSIDQRQSVVSPDRDLEMSLSQIEIPSQFANGQSNAARISSAVQIVTDKRVVELTFNPALTRAVSFDDDNLDDGLYLVLLPKNEQGQVVAVAANVNIEVIDPTREDTQAIICQWNYSAREVENKIQPLGSKQGIHLTLPWNGSNPKSDKIMVVATYQFDNGRKLVAKKEIYLNHNAGLKTVWTPRAAGRNEAGTLQDSGPVVTASATSPVGGSNNPAVSSVGSYPLPESAPAPVPAMNEGGFRR